MNPIWFGPIATLVVAFVGFCLQCYASRVDRWQQQGLVQSQWRAYISEAEAVLLIASGAGRSTTCCNYPSPDDTRCSLPMGHSGTHTAEGLEWFGSVWFREVTA